jgi:alkylresorcinol/alkylpyrone synthase
MEGLTSQRNPQILSIGFAVPERGYSQNEIFRQLGYPRGYRRLFSSSGISRRYFWVELERITGLSFQEQQEEYLKGSLFLSQKAIDQCLDGSSPESVGCVSYCSCTGFSPGPAIPHYLARDIHFAPNTYFCNIVSHGCEGGYPGLKRALDYTLASRKPSLVIACELSSCAIYPESGGVPDPTNHFEIMRANALFGDAASCALIGYDREWRHPSIMDMETYTNTDYLDQLGFVWDQGRLRVRLARDIPIIAVKVIQPVMETLLRRNHLTTRDINWFVIHAAGNTVIDNLRDALDIPEEKTQLSRDTLRDYGNTSSTSVGITGKRLMSQNIRPGDYTLILSIGPGMTGGATLLRFGIA